MLRYAPSVVVGLGTLRTNHIQRHATGEVLEMKKPTPLRLDVHLPKFQAEREKQRAIDSAKFMAALKASRWTK